MLLLQHGLSALGVAASCGVEAEEKVKLLLAFGGAPEPPLSPRTAERADAAAVELRETAAQRLAAFAFKRYKAFALRQAAAGTATALPGAALAALNAAAAGAGAAALGGGAFQKSLEATGASLKAPVIIGLEDDLPALLQAVVKKDTHLVCAAAAVFFHRWEDLLVVLPCA